MASEDNCTATSAGQETKVVVATVLGHEASSDAEEQLKLARLYVQKDRLHQANEIFFKLKTKVV